MVESDSVFYSRVSTIPWTSWYLAKDICRVGSRAEVDGIWTVDDEVSVVAVNGTGADDGLQENITVV